MGAPSPRDIMIRLVAHSKLRCIWLHTELFLRSLNPRRRPQRYRLVSKLPIDLFHNNVVLKVINIFLYMVHGELFFITELDIVGACVVVYRGDLFGEIGVLKRSVDIVHADNPCI